MAKVAIMPSGCWEWVGGKMRNGYGTFWFEGRLQAAHRASYKMFVGEIPEGLDLDHLCRNRPCINVEHLEPVTRSENLLRSPRKEWSAARSHPHLHPRQKKVDIRGRR